MAAPEADVAALRERIRELEAECAETGQLAAIGATMRGLAHSVRGAQGLCLASTHMVERALRKDDREEFDRAWAMVKRSLSRVAELCHGLLDPEAAGRPTLQSGDPDVLVADVCEVAAEEAADQGDSFELRLAGDLQGMVFDSLAVRRCCLELVGNALDAVSETSAAAGIVVTTARADDGWFLEVADSGPGMTPELLQQVMAGGVTTKGKGGSGLGLQQVRILVKQHGGRLDGSSQPGKGTSFRCWFPAVPEGRGRDAKVEIES